MYKLMVADYDSPSYFVATAAVKLGFFKQQGLEVEFIPEYGAKHGPERLRDVRDRAERGRDSRQRECRNAAGQRHRSQLEADQLGAT